MIKTRKSMGGLLAAALMSASLALSGCDDLLKVELPAEMTDEVLGDPAGATLQMNTVVGNFEYAFNDYFWDLAGREDTQEVFARSPGTNRAAFSYASIASSTAGTDWFNEMNTARLFAESLHEKLDKAWTVKQVADRAKYLAITSMYAGAVYSYLGGTMCEMAVDAGPMVKPDEAYTKAEAALTRAITEIQAVTGGDFVMPFGVSTSALNMAYGLRAQLRWQKGDMAGAKLDAEKIPKGFRAFITRESVPDRRNVAYDAGGGGGGAYAEVLGLNDWWKGTNPVTGKAWPTPLPFTGYTYLGILPDGRAVREDGLPIRTQGTNRLPEESTAVADARVTTVLGVISGKGGVSRPTNVRFSGIGDDIPLVNWKEMWLIRAEAEGGQRAIDLVNEIRTNDKMPLVTYASAANATQIKYMIFEERRRALWLEGRFFFTKMKNLDTMWFPRGVGITPEGGLALGGGVRFIMPDTEYQLNPNLTLDSKATGCATNEKPLFNLG